MSLLGLVLFFARRLPPQWNFPAGIVLAAAILFLLVLATGATYAGIRRALPVVVLLSIFAGLFAERALTSISTRLKTVAVLAYVLAAASTVPVMRPREYFNELVGGTHNAYRYFDDEGVDLGQRTKELAAYYRRFVKPGGEIPAVIYWSSEEELKGREVEYLGRDKERDMERLSQPDRSGAILASPLPPVQGPFWKLTALRETQPVARFGNLSVYQGTFHLPGLAASDLYWEGIQKLYAEKSDPAAAEKFFQKSVELDPTACFVHIELGNLLLKRGAREEALHAYSAALKYAPDDRLVRQPIEKQIARFADPSLAEIPRLRNPFLE